MSNIQEKKETSVMYKFMMWCICVAILCRLGGCGSEDENNIERRLDRIEQSIEAIK